MKTYDLLIKNANQVLTCAGYYPKRKGNASNLVVREDGYVIVHGGKIAEVGENYVWNPNICFTNEINACGKVVMPGFVDCHTHLVHGGSREDEFMLKVGGKPYLEILKAGGGILSTVKATREASKEELKRKALKTLDTMLEYGTTTIEAKTGYGLELETELKCLEVMDELDHPVDIVKTFLGAHAFPAEYKGHENLYVVEVLDMLGHVEGKAEFCDVFCEGGVFTKEQSKLILDCAKIYHGLKPKMHVDEITEGFKGAELAAEIGCVSADHLDMISEEGMRMMAEKGVVGVLLPGVPFHLMTGKYAPANEMIEKRMALALATDYNPGSCPTKSMQTVIELAVRKMKMPVEAAINASTVNAAHAIDRKNIGRLMPNYQADIAILDIPSYKCLPYEFGTNKVCTVIKKGKVVVENGKKNY